MANCNGSPILMDAQAPGLANYPHARLVNKMLYISGISSRNRDSKSWRGAEEKDGKFILDIKEQTRGRANDNGTAVIENIQNILRQAGLGLENLVDLTVFLVDMKDYAEFNQVYNEYFKDPSKGPARTTIAVHQLPNPRLLIEIKSVAFAG
jgi:2-aminomuconate deaminase